MTFVALSLFALSETVVCVYHKNFSTYTNYKNPPQIQGRFLPAADIFEEFDRCSSRWLAEHAPEEINILTTLTSSSSVGLMKPLLKSFNIVCDVQTIEGHGTLYRYSESKAIQWLLSKVQRIASSEAIDKIPTLMCMLAKHDVSSTDAASSEGLKQGASFLK